MSHCLFIHDFFRDGRLDVLAEIRKLQVRGQWTKQKRAHWTKQAVACYERAIHTYPYLPQGSSYYAGRIAGLKSAITARYPKLDQCSKTVVFALPGETSTLCRECRDRATWECYNKHGKVTSLCDRCKQELVRAQTAYITPDGWDWNEHEDHLLPLSVPVGNKLMVKEGLEPTSFFFPCTATVGLAMLEVAFHLPLTVVMLELMLFVHFMTYRKEILEGFRKFFKSEL